MTNFTNIPHVTVADMIAALSALPADARLVVTQSGYYCYDDFADFCKVEFQTDISAYPSFMELPTSFCQKAMAQPRTLARCIKKFKKAVAQ